MIETQWPYLLKPEFAYRHAIAAEARAHVDKVASATGLLAATGQTQAQLLLVPLLLPRLTLSSPVCPRTLVRRQR